MNATGRAGAIIIQNQAVALIKRRRQNRRGEYYLFPGGKVEPGETLPQAVIREVREELGLVIEVGKLIAKVYFNQQSQYYFLADAVGGEFGTGDGLEIQGAISPEAGTYTPVWMPVPELLTISIYPTALVKIIIQSALEGWPSEVLIWDDIGDREQLPTNIRSEESS